MLKLEDIHPFRWLASRRGTEPLFAEYLADKAFEPWFESFDVTWPEFDAWLGATYPDLATYAEDERSDYRDREVTALDATAKFIHAGRHVVAPTPALQRLLHRTDLTGLRLSDVRLPYPVIHVALGSFSRMPIEGDRTEIDGVTVGHGPGGRGLGLVFTTRLKNGRERRRSREAYDILPVVKVILQDDTPGGMDLAALVDRDIGLGARVMRSARVGLAGLPSGFDHSKYMRMDAATYAEHLEVAERRGSNLRTATNLALNVLAYMMACPEDAREEWPVDAPREDPKAARRPGAAETRRRHLRRQGFVPIRVIAPSLQESSAPGSAGQSLSEAHWRRGHWRRQRVGVGLSEVRPILIRPTIVRPDLEMTRSPRLYKVEPRPAPVA